MSITPLCSTSMKARTATYRPSAKVEAYVYVIDSDANSRRNIVGLVSHMNIEVSEFDSAEAFLSQPAPHEASCLICETNLPGMTGLELLHTLKRERRTLPTIFMSSESDVELAVRAMKAGAIDFIEKPFFGRLLMTRIHDVLGVTH